MSLQERLEGYRVTTVPGPARLRLSWCVAERSGGAAREATPSADGDAGDDGGGSASLDVLESYRITRVPVPTGSS